MAQTGYTPIQLYYSSTTTNVPLAADLANGELAINITDGKLFYKDNANAVQVIGWKVVPTTAGGTGLTTYTAGDTVYYASGTTLSKLAIGANTTVMTSSGSAPQWTAQSSLSVGTASNLLSNATTGKMQIVGPAAGSTRVMTIPDANFTAARTDAAQTFTGTQTFSSDVLINSATFGKGASGLSANTAGGNGALASATSGNFNTGFGYRALNKITTGAGNVAVGQGALENNDNAYSVALGANSLNTTTNGYRNTAAGKDSLLGLTSGYDMTAVGYSAGSNATTGNNNAFWGNNAQPSAAGVSNEYTYGDSNVTTHRFYGNLTPVTAAKGINFTANTPAAGMTSQLMNWYEQGSFTPVLTCATPGTLAVTYATQTAKYQRVGNVCHVWINIQTNSVTVGTASGAVRITGLPFTSSLNGVESSMGSMMFQGITKASYTQFSPQVVWTTTYMAIVASGTGQSVSNVTIGEISTGTNLFNIYVAYIVA